MLTGFKGAPTHGSATIRVFTRAGRWRRALTAIAEWWGLALAAVFVPVAHLLLVPSLLLYGGWQFVSRVRTTDLVIRARGRCPDCGTEQKVDLAAQWRVPQPVTCRACQRGLTVANAG